MANDYRAVSVDQASFNAALAALSALGASDGVVAKVASRSINRALPTARLAASKEIGAEVTCKATTIKGAMKYDKATVRKLQGALVARGRKLNLIHFQAKQTKEGVTARVYKKGERELYKHAYIHKTQKGNFLVMERTAYKGPRKPWNPQRAYGKMPKEYRLPIGPKIADIGIPHMLAKSEIMNPTLKAGGDALVKNANREMNYELGKL